MKKTTYVCDHCGKEINLINDYTEMEINDFDFVKDVDLCEHCHNELCNIIRKFIGEEYS